MSEGSFGSIKACERLADGAVVAVKLIEQPTHRYATERRVLEVSAKGDTPFVLSLLDAFEAPGVAALVTPLYDGDAHDLLRAVRAQRRTEVDPRTSFARASDRLSRNFTDAFGSSKDVVEANGLDNDTALKIVAHTASALDWLHARKVAHRDLKPENVLCAGGGGPQARFVLADFGVVGVGCGPTTGARTLVGTPEYAAPEMAQAFLANGGDVKVLQAFEKSSRRGHGLGSFFRRRSKQMRGQNKAIGKTEYGHACDWFALGCLLYELSVGSPPKRGVWAASKQAKGLDGDVASTIDWLRAEDPSRRCGVRNGLNDVRRAGPSVAKALDATTLLQKTFKDKPRLSPTKDLKTQPSPVKKPSGTRDWARRRDMLAPPPPTPSPPPAQVAAKLAAPALDSTPRVSPDTSPRVAQSTPPSVPKTTPARPAKTSIRDKEPRTPPVKGAGLRLFSNESPPSPCIQRRPFSDGDRVPTDAADVEVAAALASVVEAVEKAAAQTARRARRWRRGQGGAPAAAADAAAAAERARAAAAAEAAEQPAQPFDITSSEWSPRAAVRSRMLALEARIIPRGDARARAPGGAAAAARPAGTSWASGARRRWPRSRTRRRRPPARRSARGRAAAARAAHFVADLRRPPMPPQAHARSTRPRPPAPTVAGPSAARLALARRRDDPAPAGAAAAAAVWSGEADDVSHPSPPPPSLRGQNRTQTREWALPLLRRVRRRSLHRTRRRLRHRPRRRLRGLHHARANTTPPRRPRSTA